MLSRFHGAPYPAANFGFNGFAGYGYGPANWAESNMANFDDMASFQATERADWDGFIGARDTLASKDYAKRSDAAWKLGNQDSENAMKARKAQYKAWANADNDSVDASNDYWKATNYYSVASEDDAIARQDIAAAMRATAIEKNAKAVAERAHNAAARYVKGANKAQRDEQVNIKDSKEALKDMIKSRKAQAQHATEAHNDMMDADSDKANAVSAYDAADVYGYDAQVDAWQAANAYGAEYSNAWAAQDDAWMGMNAGFAAATPQYGYGMGWGRGYRAPYMW